MDFVHVTSADADSKNVNGLKELVHFNERSNITAWPVQAASTDASNLGVKTGNYTVASGKPFKRVTIDHEVSIAKFEGQTDGAGPFKVSADLFIRGSKADIDGFCNALQYSPDMAFVIPQGDGVRVQIGNEDYPARVKAMFDSKETKASDPRGWKLEISSYSVFKDSLSSATLVPIV